MITKIDIFNQKFYSPPLSLVESGDAGTDPIQILNITGLEPVKANINTTQYVQVDGETLSGITIGKRNIVITVGLNPNWQDQTIDSLRTILYSYFLPRSSVKLRFESTHLQTCEISGYVESMEENRFSKDPKVDISIICPNPDFVAVDSIAVSGDVVAMGSLIMTEISYSGSVPTGFELLLTQTGVVHTETGKDTVVLTTTPAPSAMILSQNHNSDINFLISTVLGKKFVRAVGVGVYSGIEGSILPALDDESEWPILYPGDNQFVVMSGSSNLTGSDWTLTYFERYGGL